jgi:NAD+ dependent glucose-6-phosphate dehydrogenase
MLIVNKKVGITGAAGHIGLDLAVGLAEKYQLTLFYHHTKPDIALDLKMVQTDLSDEKQVKGLFDGLDAVIHMAAASSPLSSWEDVLSQNIIATYNVFEETRRARVSKVVFGSTNHTQHAYVMGTPFWCEDLSLVKKHGLIKLSDPPAPDSLYGVSKLFGEDLGRYYSRLFGIKVVSLRIGFAERASMIDHMKQDDQSIKEHIRFMYLSTRDLIEITEKALQSDKDYVLVYAVSDNKPAVFDLTETKEKLGFNPKDNSQTWEANLKL